MTRPSRWLIRVASRYEAGQKYGIRVNTICPTFILTPLTAPFFDEPETRRWIGQNIPLGRAGEVGDVAGAAVYLASDASALVTGSALSVDGGWTAV